jgi:hypothetical protein
VILVDILPEMAIFLYRIATGAISDPIIFGPLLQIVILIPSTRGIENGLRGLSF